MSVAEFLGLRRNVILLLAAIVIIGAGEETWMRFVPKYLELLGAGAFIIGLYDAIKTLLGAVYAYPGGVLADRWGHRRALVAFNAVSMAGYALVILVPHWAAVLGATFLFLAWSTFSLPATFSLVGANLPAHKHTMGIGVQSLMKRLPIMVGPVAGGVLIDRFGMHQGVRIGAGISIVLGALTIWVQQQIREQPPRAAAGNTGLGAVLRAMDPRLKRLLLSDILIRFCERIPFAWVVIYAMNNVGATATQVGLLIAVEMATAVACYVPVSHWADRTSKEPFVIATFVFFTLFPLTLLAAHSFPLLIAAFVVRGLKEFGDPSRKALLIHYAPPESRGRVIGAYYLVRDTLVAGGSFLGAALWKLGPTVNFWSAAALGTAGTVYYIATLRREQAKQQDGLAGSAPSHERSRAEGPDR
jgi:MFS family permease